MPSVANPARVLVAVLVYNGREFVPRCLESLTRLEKGAAAVDILVLDDHSPDPGWSNELAGLCSALGLDYYRSPRNLGIPRNFNLGLLRAITAGYDHVILLNSDVVVPYNMVDRLVAAASADDRVASVTAWSNNCSIYSLTNSDPDRLVSGQDEVDWISETLGDWSAPEGLEIPVGVGFCLLLRVEVARQIGLFDPVFGRGYCEENDWCLRAKAAGWRNVLATNVFVYHLGGGSTRDAGLVAPGETTVHAHERVIDWRYPDYRADLLAFEQSGAGRRMVEEGVAQIVLTAARQWGYEVRLTSLPLASVPEQSVQFLLGPGGAGSTLVGHFRGFAAHFLLDPSRTVLENIVYLIGREPERAVVGASGPQADTLMRDAATARVPVELRNFYPERI